jgi:drug/metabolite transporter (DMT)-like permease
MERRDNLINHALLAAVVFGWSTSWIAAKLQTGVIAPEVSVFWRFLIAAPLVFLYARFAGGKLRFAAREHLAFAAMGVLIFSTNFVLVYHGALFLTSGLLSVVFALASIINLVLARLIFGDPISWKVGMGGLLGFTGVALMFEPEIEKAAGGTGVLTGLAFCVAGTFSFCCGNMISTWLQRRRVPVIGASAWGMLYGTLWTGLMALATGARFTVELTWPYLGGLVWLVVFSTVGAFLTYLTLLGRVGAARAGYATVLFPVFALAISAAFEGYRFTDFALIGLACVAIGNGLVLRR